MRMFYNIEAVQRVIDSNEAQAFVQDGWILLSVNPAGVALPGIPHQDLIYELGWPCKIEDSCCLHEQSGRRSGKKGK